MDYIYNSQAYSHLTMYGGTSLRVCFNLNRMSEDIDFETTKPFDKMKFAQDIKQYFSKKIQYRSLTTHVPGKGVSRVELRFPLLHELGLSAHDGENLIVKVEANTIDKNYPSDFKTITEGRFGFVVRHYILPVLMAGKILACLDRIWEKSGVKIKGRDYYDLIWYMQKGVIPDRDYLADKGYTREEAFKKLGKKIELIKPGDLLADLIPLFENPDFPKNWSEVFKRQFVSLHAQYHWSRD
ncbi:MAG: nucleotidyl transferase AbiEii/AbiGii toxin family protein [Deltaproteobacteria bacterium]|nr:nucleotidyl transferase AbiEii/AbiGii toxin family protein [Deltaproteobacteria bacterium]